MDKVMLCYHKDSDTMDIWFGNPEDEYICEEAGEGVILIKYDQLKTDITREIENIEQVLRDLASLRQNVELSETDKFKNAAFGTFLMNFYSGVENIVKRISRQYYHTMPKGASWHKELLILACHPPEGKIPLFSSDIKSRLNPYRDFKHVFISGYGFKLQMELMLPLVNDIEGLWTDIKQAIKVTTYAVVAASFSLRRLHYDNPYATNAG